MSDRPESFDVAVIGSGVAGALIASRIVRDCSVVLIDAGTRDDERLQLVERFAIAANKTPHSPYASPDADRLATSPDGPDDYDQVKVTPEHKDGLRSGYERRVGGSTWHWLGHTPRLLPNDFRLFSKYGIGVDWPIDYAQLEESYCEAERELGVAGNNEEWTNLLDAFRSQPFPMPKVWPSYSDLRVSAMLAKAGVSYEGMPLEVKSTPSARNTEPYQGRAVCSGNSSCVPLCPIGAKYDATVHVRRAENAGAATRFQSVVVQIDVDVDGRVTGVTYKDWEGKGHKILASVVVLAAHAIESPRILLMSRTAAGTTVANSSDQVGRNLMDHLQKAALGLAPEPLFPYRGPPSTSGIDTTRDGPFRRHRGAFRISLGNDGWKGIGAPYSDVVTAVTHDGLFGSALRERLASRVQRQLRLSCSTEMKPNGSNRVSLSRQLDALGLPRPHIEFAADDYVKKALAAATDAMQLILNTVGATEQQIDRDFDSYSGAGHIMGTARMGRDPRSSVVDADCRSHDHPNLFIVGASVFPTCGTANPTLTVAAIALRSVGAIRETAIAARASRQ